MYTNFSYRAFGGGLFRKNLSAIAVSLILSHSVIKSECKLLDFPNNKSTCITNMRKHTYVRSKDIPGDFTFVISEEGIGYVLDNCIK